MTPAKSYITENRIVYEFPYAGYQLPLGDPFTVIAEGIKALIPWPFPVNYTFEVPQPANFQDYVYSLQLEVAARLFPTNNAGDYYPTRIYVKSYGNVPLGTNQLLIDGAPLATPFTDQSNVKLIGGSFSSVQINTLEMQVSVALADLQTTGIFKPEPSANDWTIRADCLVRVILEKRGTNQN